MPQEACPISRSPSASHPVVRPALPVDRWGTRIVLHADNPHRITGGNSPEDGGREGDEEAALGPDRKGEPAEILNSRE